MPERGSILSRIWRIRNDISNIKQDSSFVNGTHLKNDGSVAEFCGWPLFTGSVVSSKLRSIATGSVPNGNGANFATDYARATANGANWYTTTFADEVMIRLLFPLLCKSTDSQGCIGGGASHSSAPYLRCGQLSDKGYFWGHSEVTTTTPHGSKFLCMENVWGELWRKPCGIVAIGNSLYTKMTPSMVDGSSYDGFLAGNNAADYVAKYVKAGWRGPYANAYNGYTISSISDDCAAPTWPRALVSTSPQYTTHYCDMGYLTGGSDPVICVFGGSCANAAYSCGIYAVDASLDVTTNYWAYAPSLSYHFY